MNRVERGRWKLVSKINRAKAVAGCDENIGNCFIRLHNAVLRAALSINRNEVVPTQTMRPPFSLNLIQSGCGVWRHLAPFAMHFVGVNIFNFDRQKSARPDMQRHLKSETPCPLIALSIAA